MEKHKLLFTECMFPQYTNPDCINFPNTIFPNGEWMVPRPLSRTIRNTPFGSGGINLDYLGFGIWVSGDSGYMKVGKLTFGKLTETQKSYLTSLINLSRVA